MQKTNIILVASAAALAAGIAYAQPGKGPMKGQGGAMVGAHFAQMDANNDGNVDHDEFIAFQTMKNEQRWAMFSAHAGDDGVVSLEEAKAHHADMQEMHGAMRGEGKRDGNCKSVSDSEEN